MHHGAGSAEFKWRHLIEAVEEFGQGFTVFDRDLNLILCNNRFLEMLNFPASLVHPGTVFADFMRFNALRGEYGPGDVEELVAERVDRARGFAPHCFERERPDGTVIEVRGTPLPGGGFVTTYTDITERKRAERMLIHAKDKAEETARIKANFLATMSHEIRTPMNGVLGMLHLLTGSPLTPEQRDHLETAQSSARSLLSIINDILDFSKLEAGQMKMESTRFDLYRLMEEMGALLKGAAMDKGLDLRLHIAANVPRHHCGDSNRLRQILTNLMGNAVKFTERGGVEVLVEALPDSRLRFQVADSGIGIDPAAASGLFSEFVQADSSITRRFGGTGLGLSICKKLVEMMGGEIGFDSVPGQGTTFHVVLPFTPASDDGRAAAIEEQIPDLPPMAVLLAEDNPVNQKLTTVLLNRWGQQVTLARNGAEAIAALARQHFDLVLMDVHMPGIDGLEATRRIRAMSGPVSRIPIIAMTADALDGDAALCLEAGMDDYVAKPVDPALLLAALHRAVRR
ncbi:PAS/PAC sensor hybrid histidine kinase [Paramagnetospirillum magnetotacticum MS-1]|uniref:histidine kinase n=1 Tax=Paramagnetospirillum magnetotacticum MS-1 TaxID=272627 RepID=A0A0C2UFS6_PARME|nr:PAS-domain containing protein [Paramagnetospirillum magnetotacticum]KIM00373.1 PAS/PAC sensor hybrid histidine kinase [Paramagnetospirillum magnetotacticum MS-1]